MNACGAFTLTRAQARTFDRHAIEVIGIPPLVLMENAGRGAARLLFEQGIDGMVFIACGKGNNGGDGLVMARHLTNWGIAVEVAVFAQEGDLSPEAATHWRIVQKMGLSARCYHDAAKEAKTLAERFARAAWIVDALYGTGLTGPVRPPFDRVIECINASGVPVFAVDLPSGLDADSGEPLGPTIRARHTATFIAPKVGFLNPAAAAYTGQVHVVDIGFTPATLAKNSMPPG